MKPRLVLLLVVMAAAGMAGCGDDTKVGDESLLNFQEQAQERLGQLTTTTTVPPVTDTTAAAPPGAPGGAGGPQAPAATATTGPPAVAPTPTTQTTVPAPQVATLEIFIFDDNAPAPVEPQYARVFVNSIVRWVNNDSLPRAVVAVSGQFRSPMIPPGGTFEYRATTAGIFDYGDGTRPYVNATLEVLER